MRTPAGRDDLISSIFFLTPSMTLSAFSPYRITTIPPTVSPLPSSSAIPRRISPPRCTAATYKIFRGRDLESLATYIGVACFDRADDVAERDVVGDERVWIEIDLVLLYEAADRRDFRDPFHRRERIAQIPILN